MTKRVKGEPFANEKVPFAIFLPKQTVSVM